MRAGSDAGAGAECRVRVDLAGKPQRSLAEALDVGQESVRVVLGTFNLGGKQPPSRQELEHWMPVSSNCDVYVVGVQECNYKPQVRQQQEGPAASKAVAGHGKGDSCDQDWLCTLQEHFRPGGHVLLGSHSIQHTAAIKLTVFVHQRHAFKVKNVCWDAYACGVGGVYGNKGAVGCRLYLNETPLVFVNVHLAAHEGAAHDRNVNTANILQKLSLGGNQSLDVLPQTSYLFYLGDLNYRVNIEYQEAVRLVKEKNQRELVLKDELQGERAEEQDAERDEGVPHRVPADVQVQRPQGEVRTQLLEQEEPDPFLHGQDPIPRVRGRGNLAAGVLLLRRGHHLGSHPGQGNLRPFHQPTLQHEPWVLPRAEQEADKVQVHLCQEHQARVTAAQGWEPERIRLTGQRVGRLQGDCGPEPQQRHGIGIAWGGSRRGRGPREQPEAEGAGADGNDGVGPPQGGRRGFGFGRQTVGGHQDESEVCEPQHQIFLALWL